VGGGFAGAGSAGGGFAGGAEGHVIGQQRIGQCKLDGRFTVTALLEERGALAVCLLRLFLYAQLGARCGYVRVCNSSSEDHEHGCPPARHFFFSPCLTKSRPK